MRLAAPALCALLLAAAPSLAGQDAGPAPADWRRGGVCYEVFVRSFYDSDGDGVGDLRGLTEKLDYINDGVPGVGSDLGARCIWLMPVAPSPSYHGYDVTDYYAVNRAYGSAADFKEFVAQAHRRGIRVIVDLVLNHMSSEHPYFQSALADTASAYRDWFLWSPTQRRTDGWNVPTWHRAPARDEYYYGLFWHGMPDLRLDHPEVRAEVERITRFWLQEMDVDGFRLDAVGHFFERGTDPRHGPGTHPFLRDFQAHVQRTRPGAFTVGEVWDSVGAQLRYYPDQLDAYFAFEVSDALLQAVRTGAGERLVAAVQRVQRDIPPGRWASFQRNHDQTRTATEFGGDLRRARLSASLLLTLPGIPFVYYGEELGMAASKPDERLRTPMHWARQPAAGFTRGTAWEPLQADSLTANVQVQEGDPSSLLNHYRRLIHLREAHPALGSAGEFIPLQTRDPSVLAYLRRAEGQTVLVVANLGAHPVSRAALSSADSVLRAGRHVARPLFGGGRQSSVTVVDGGRLSSWVPVPVMAPLGAYVFEIARRR